MPITLEEFKIYLIIAGVVVLAVMVAVGWQGRDR